MCSFQLLRIPIIRNTRQTSLIDAITTNYVACVRCAETVLSSLPIQKGSQLFLPIRTVFEKNT